MPAWWHPSPRSPGDARPPRRRAPRGGPPQQRRRHRVHGRGEVGDEAEQRRIELGVRLAHAQDRLGVRAHRRVDLVRELQLAVLRDRQQPAQELGLGRLDAHERESELLRPLEHERREFELLVGGHVAITPTPHVEVGSEGALDEPVPVERRAPRAHEVVADDRIGRDHLGCHDLDAGTDPEFRDPVEQAVEVVPAGTELRAGGVEREPELERIGVDGGRRGRHLVRERRGRGIRVDDRQRPRVAHHVRHVQPGAAVGPGCDLHVRQAQLAVQHDVVRLAERDRLGETGDEQRVLLQEPQRLALLGQLVEAVRVVAELEPEVIGIHRLSVDGERERRDRRQPQAAVPGDRQPKRESVGVGTEAVVVDESVRHGGCLRAGRRSGV